MSILSPVFFRVQTVPKRAKPHNARELGTQCCDEPEMFFIVYEFRRKEPAFSVFDVIELETKEARPASDQFCHLYIKTGLFCIYRCYLKTLGYLTPR